MLPATPSYRRWKRATDDARPKLGIHPNRRVDYELPSDAALLCPVSSWNAGQI